MTSVMVGAEMLLGDMYVGNNASVLLKSKFAEYSISLGGIRAPAAYGIGH